MTRTAKTVVVLGAGAGGLTAAERLRANLPGTDRVVLIDRSFTVSSGLSALGVLRGLHTPAEVTAAVGAAALPGVELRTGEVTGIDPDAKRVLLAAGDPVGYDALVIALGAVLDTAALPGLDAAIAAGVAGQFYTPEGAAALHRGVDQLSTGRVVVLVPPPPFKCPPAPYEAAFRIADQLGARFTDGAVRVDVITAEPRPVPVVSPGVGTGLVDLLEQTGIGFTAQRTVTAVDAATCTLTFADGGTERFDLLATVPPHRSPVADLLPGAVNPGGWLPVDGTTLATGLPGVWAIGDVAALLLADGKPAPKAGFIAESGGRTVADQVARHLGYDVPDTRLTAVGGCIVVVGDGVAAKVAGDFLAAPAPDVALLAPDTGFYDEKLELEQSWLARWGA
ncbi:FAD-dependent oxidoreductase [Mycobacterium sp. M1]|uniref:FAD-dependent oxidoreductase n=1 Tax=Mycolicibacter acidiphilus TaxID=2835306 RepID=A0ABS5RJU1_9MYCO|nr:FAD-dependent oxidoreductase [Mycolicibacter acidiphilus]MBS9534570.1 FAD-dependent oxidoreductase [Mycolicibacter acidiphilus]